MHISFVHCGRIYPYFPKAPGRVAYNLVKEFDRNGIRVDFLLLWDGPPPRERDLGFSPNVRIHMIKRRHRNFIKPLTQCLDLPGSLVHFNFLWWRPPDVSLPFLRHLKKGPIVGSIHGYVPLELQLNKTIRPPTSWVINSEYRLSLQFFDKVVVFSDYMKNLLSRHVPIERIHVLPLGVNLQYYNQRRTFPHGTDFKVLFLGRIVPVKGVDVLVKAISMLNKNNLRTMTHIIGDGPLLPRIRTLIEQLELTSRVKPCGIVSEETKRSFLNSCDVLVVPSVYEPIPTVILEAFAAGVPVIASNVGGIPELIRHGFNGLLTKASDPADLANAISILAKDTRLQRRLALNARRYVNRHDWSRVASDYVAFYKQVLSEQH